VRTQNRRFCDAGVLQLLGCRYFIRWGTPAPTKATDTMCGNRAYAEVSAYWRMKVNIYPNAALGLNDFGDFTFGSNVVVADRVCQRVH
jgi:hypothetical protein